MFSERCSPSSESTPMREQRNLSNPFTISQMQFIVRVIHEEIGRSAAHRLQYEKGPFNPSQAAAVKL